VLHMGGTEPRIYINGFPGSTETNPGVFWKNVEVTVYYQRRGTTGANWGGLVVGVRSGPNGHSSDGDPCDATTYYARFRHDARRDIEKELKHPESAPMRQQVMWPGLSLSPAGRWIGMKYIVYNVNNDQNVRLLLYCDTTTGGQATNGGKWDLLIDYTDNGNWSADAPDCPYASNFIITKGGGVVMIRNTEADSALYTMFSIREIDPVQTGAIGVYGKNGLDRECVISLMHTADPSPVNAIVSLARPLAGECALQIVNVSGRSVVRSILAAGHRYYSIPLHSGAYCAVVHGSGILQKTQVYFYIGR
jgi:hypothetical protein